MAERAVVSKTVLYRGEISSIPCKACGGECREMVTDIKVTKDDRVIHEGREVAQRCTACEAKRPVEKWRITFLNTQADKAA